MTNIVKTPVADIVPRKLIREKFSAPSYQTKYAS